MDDALAAAVPVDRVLRVPCVPRPATVVRRVLVHGVGDSIREEELSGMDDAAGDVHFDVDVHRATAVPARIDAAEDREALRIRLLDPAHEPAAVPGDA